MPRIFLLVLLSLHFFIASSQPSGNSTISAQELKTWISKNIAYPDADNKQAELNSLVLLRLHKTRLEADTLEVLTWADSNFVKQARQLCIKFNETGFRTAVPDRTIIPLVFFIKNVNSEFDRIALRSWQQSTAMVKEELYTVLQPIIITLFSISN